MCSLPKSIAIFVAQKCIIYFEQACKHAQSLEKYFKRYSHDLSSSLFFDNNDNKYKGEEDNKSEISRLYEQVEILHDEVISLHNHKNKSIMHNEENIAAMCITSIGLQKDHNLAVNSLQNLDYHFPPPGVEYKECLTINSHGFESTSETLKVDHNSCTSFNHFDQFWSKSKTYLQSNLPPLDNIKFEMESSSCCDSYFTRVGTNFESDHKFSFDPNYKLEDDIESSKPRR